MVEVGRCSLAYRPLLPVLCVISNLAEDTLSPIIQIINKDVKQD